MHSEVGYCTILAVVAFCVLVGTVLPVLCQQVGSLECVSMYFERNLRFLVILPVILCLLSEI